MINDTFANLTAAEIEPVVFFREKPNLKLVPTLPPIANRVAIVVDASCDLPKNFLVENEVAVLPVTLEIDGKTLMDHRVEADTIAFFEHRLHNPVKHAQSKPASVEAMASFFETSVFGCCGQMVMIAPSAARSRTYLNAVEAAQKLTLQQVRRRRETGTKDSFYAHVIDGDTLFAGSAVLAYEAVQRVKAGQSGDALAAGLSEARVGVHVFLLPKDIEYMQRRMTARGEKSITLVSSKVANLLDIRPIVHFTNSDFEIIDKVRGHTRAIDDLFAIACRAVMQGLDIQVVAVSYAGDPGAIGAMNGYHNLVALASSKGIEVLLAPMSMAGGLNTGAGALSVAFASKQFKSL